MPRHQTPDRPTLLGAARENAQPVRMLPHAGPQGETQRARRRPLAVAAPLLLAATVGAALVKGSAREPPASVGPQATASVGASPPSAREPAVIESAPALPPIGSTHANAAIDSTALHAAIESVPAPAAAETPAAAPAGHHPRPVAPPPAAPRRGRPPPPRPAAEPADADVDLLAAIMTRLQAVEPCRAACAPSPDPSDIPRSAAR